MFCANCSCELPAVAKFCVKCGSRVEVPHTVSRTLGPSCSNCAKPLDPSDKFCSYCGHKVIPLELQHVQRASDLETPNLEKFADRYSAMSNGDLIRLSAELSQLTEAAQKALITEIATRASKDSSQMLEHPYVSAPPVNETQAASLDWQYDKMSDEELQQLCAAYQKLHQPISDSLRSELDLRTSKQARVVTTTSSLQTQVAPTAQTTVTAEATPNSTQAREGVILQKSKPTPYGKFVLQLLLSCFCAAVGVFAMFDAFARNTTAFAIEGISTALTLVFCWLAWTTWKSIRESESKSELKSRRRVRSALVTSAVFILLYLGLAALLGSVIGQNRAEAVQLNSDIQYQRDLADRLTKARSAASNTIPSYIEMYEGIEKDVKTYSLVNLKLKEELEAYDGKFPAQHLATQKFIASIEREVRRSEMLTKQIATAKQIALLYGYQQGAAWQSDMVPLLKEEDALDKSK
jgi:hypothetical protein